MDFVTGLVAGASDAQTLTVAGLIRALQEHIAIDPDRAEQPVQVVAVGEQPRLVPAMVVATGNADPAIGGPLRVMVLCHRSI